jgi:WD40 repeat protein
MISCIFWNNANRIQHCVQCIWIWKDLIYSGGVKGEICFWNRLKPVVLASCLPEKKCLFLGGAQSPNSVLLGCKDILVSLHEDLKIRVWDRKDGRCLNTDKVTDCGKVIGLECSESRILAVVFKEVTLIYDAWTLQKLQVLKSNELIIKVQFFTDKKLVLLNEKSQVIFWHFFGTVIDPEPYFILNLNSFYRTFQINAEFNLLILLSETGLDIFKLEDLKLNHPKPWKVQIEKLCNFQIFSKNLIVLTEDRGRSYQLEEILENCLKSNFELTPKFQEVHLEPGSSFLIHSKVFWLIENGIKFIDVLDYSLQATTLNFHIKTNEFPFLFQDEILTFSFILAESWELLVGTSQGRVMITSLSSSSDLKTIHVFEGSSVTSIKLLKNFIIAGSSSGEIFIKTPFGLSGVCLIYSPASDFFPVRCVEEGSSESSQFWKNSWKHWEESLVVLSEDKSISLLSLNTQSVVSHFLSHFEHISEVVINVKSEYLLVKSQETVFVFNIINQNLERTIKGIAGFETLRKTITLNTQLDFNSSETLPSDEHKVIETNWRSSSSNKNLKLSQSLSFQNTVNPVLVFQDCPEKSQKVQISSIFTCWDLECTSHNSLLATLPNIQKTFIEPCFGIRGDGWFSFSLIPRLEYSKYIDTLRAALMFQLNKLACPELKLDIGVLSFKSLSSQTCCQSIIQDLVSTFSLKKKEKILASCKQIIHLRTPSSKVVQKSLNILGSLRNAHITSEWNRNQVSLAEAQVCLILPYYFAETPREVVLMVATSLFAMLRSGSSRVRSVGKVLKHNLSTWKTLVIPQTRQVTKEMIVFLSTVTEPQAYFKVLATLTLSDIKGSIQMITEEIEKSENSLRKTWLCFLKWLVNHKYSQLAYYSQGVVEILLKVLSPHNPVARKLCLEICSEILHVLVKALPMVDFSQSKQKIAVGTSEGTIVIYDLKTANFWKCLEGHSGPLSAVMFSATGSSIVSYSSHDLSVRLWKIEIRFYQEFFSAKNITPSGILTLVHVKSGVSHYKEFVEGVKFLVRDGLKLVREDLKEYEINFNLV